MDTPSQESTGPLNQDSAAAAFAALLSETTEVKEPQEGPADTPTEAHADDASEVADETSTGDSEKVTIEVDGKTVELSKEELAEAYKSGLRQSDYTRKTMEAAEQRKAADAEVAKARQERHEYATNLQNMQAQLEGAIQQQAQTDWDQLLNSDPIEFMRQQHLLQQRQAALAENQRQQGLVQRQAQFEAEEAAQRRRSEQSQALLEKMPDWKDEAKAKAGKIAIADYLKSQGFDSDAIGQISDHRAVLLANKAMLYDAMMDKAKAAAKKVVASPQKVVKPGVGESPNLDKRGAAFQRLSKSGRVEDAAALFQAFV